MYPYITFSTDDRYVLDQFLFLMCVNCCHRFLLLKTLKSLKSVCKRVLFENKWFVTITICQAVLEINGAQAVAMHTVDSLATGHQGNYASLSLSAINGMDYRLLNFTCRSISMSDI